MKTVEIILIICTSLLLYNCKKYNEYEKVNLEMNDIGFDHYQLNQSELKDSLLDQGYVINLGKFNNGPFIKKKGTDFAIRFDDIIRIAEVMSDTIVITSGVRGLDSGLKYFFGTYSEIYIVNKSNLTVLHKFAIDEIVTNARVRNNMLYFWYGSSNNYKLGKISLL